MYRNQFLTIRSMRNSNVPYNSTYFKILHGKRIDKTLPNQKYRYIYADFSI